MPTASFTASWCASSRPKSSPTRNDEFVTLDKTYRGILERGDTINDAVVRMWRERRAELLIDGPEPGTL